MIAAFAPATVSNVAAGFDVLGFALDQPGDVVMAALADGQGATIAEVHGDGGRLPRDPGRNTASAAANALLAALGTRQGVSLVLHKGLPLASGVGSSGASAVAAVVAVNELLGRPAGLDLLLRCAMAGEQAGCGAVHPDNVAPALYGGFVLAQQRRSARHRPPAGAGRPGLRRAASGHRGPHGHGPGAARRHRAAEGRGRQWANLGAIVAALYSGDLELLSRALEDHVAEPRRAGLVPGFHAIKAAALAGGALGCSLSGSGPSMFALARTLDDATAAGEAMAAAWAAAAPSCRPTCGCRRSAPTAPA